MAGKATLSGYVLPGDTSVALGSTTRQQVLPRLTPTAAKTAAYTATVGDLVMVDASAGPVTVTLPSTSVGAAVGVKKVDSSANVVTVAAASGNTIGSAGASSVPLRLTDQAAAYQANGANWVIERSHLSLAALDARFVSAGDSRLSDARTPTGHAGTHGSGGSDPVTPAAIGAAADSAVVHVVGDETVAGVKTFTSAPVVPTGGADGNPVRRDDTRLVADQAAGTASVRTLGSGAQQAAAGNHAHSGGGASAGFWQSVRSGYYYPRPFAWMKSSSPTLNQLVATPWFFDAAVPITAIAFSASAAASSRVVRIGVYADSAGAPGALTLDAGSIAAPSSTGYQVSASLTLGPGRVWLAAVVQGATGGLITDQTSVLSPSGIPVPPAVPTTNSLTSNFDNIFGGIYHNGTVSGALPSTFSPPTTFGPSGDMPLLRIKVA